MAAAAQQQQEGVAEHILYSKIDVNNITFNANPANIKKYKCVLIKYRNDDFGINPTNLIIQTPPMYAPFGITNYKGSKKYHIDLSMRGEHDESFGSNMTSNANKKKIPLQVAPDKLQLFRTKMEEIDNKILEILKDKNNADRWIPSDFPHNEDSIKRHYKKIIKAFVKKPDTDKVHPDNFKVTVPYKYESEEDTIGHVDPTLEIYDIRGNAITLEDVIPGSTVVAIVHFQALTFVSGNVHWRKVLRALQVKPPPAKLTGFRFLTEYLEDDEEEQQEIVKHNDTYDDSDCSATAATDNNKDHDYEYDYDAEKFTVEGGSDYE